MTRPRILQKLPDVIREEMVRMDVDPAGIEIMAGKGHHLAIQIGPVGLRAAMILKQDILSLGGEAALSRKAASLKPETTPVLLMGTLTQLCRLTEKLKGQPFGLSDLATRLEGTLDSWRSRPVFRAGGRDLLAGAPVAVMGVLNVTTDSFSDGGRTLEAGAAMEHGLAMAEEGAAIIDVGGESTRPGAAEVDEETEASRVLPVITGLRSRWEGPVSVDTTKSGVARRAAAAGAAIINDISGLTFDAAMPDTVAESGASLVVMHTRARPAVMQGELDYDDLVGEVYIALEGSLEKALSAGVSRDKICVDPGIGFGKSFEQNLVLLNRIGEFRSLGCAVMVGASRKSFIGHFLETPVEDRLEGSLAAAACAVMGGASLVRAHDVKETVRATRMAALIMESRG